MLILMMMVMMMITTTATVMCTVGKRDGSEEDLTLRPWVWEVVVSEQGTLSAELRVLSLLFLHAFLSFQKKNQQQQRAPCIVTMFDVHRNPVRSKSRDYLAPFTIGLLRLRATALGFRIHRKSWEAWSSWKLLQSSWRSQDLHTLK